MSRSPLADQPLAITDTVLTFVFFASEACMIEDGRRGVPVGVGQPTLKRTGLTIGGTAA